MMPATMNDSTDDNMSLIGEEEQFNEEAGPETEEDDPEIAKKETRAVLWIRIFVLTVLLLTTVTVAYLVHYYIEESEEDNFHESFEHDALTVLEAVGNVLDLTLGAADSFAVGLVSYAYQTDSDWPFVVLPDFGVRSTKLRALSKAVLNAYYPIVSTDDRAAWEGFASKNNGWVSETIRVQTMDQTYHGEIVTEWQPLNFIHGLEGPVQYDGPYVPQWQTSPTVPKFPFFPYGWDMMFLDFSRLAVEEVMNHQTVVIQKTFGVVCLVVLLVSRFYVLFSWNGFLTKR